MLKSHFAVINFFRIAVDAVSIGLIWNAVYFLRFYSGWFGHSHIPSYRRHLLLTLPIIIILYLCRLWMGIYKSMRIETTFRLLRKQIESILLGYLFVIFFLYYLEKTPYTRVLLFLFFLLLMGGMLLSQMLVLMTLRYVRSRGYNQRFYGIIGTGKAAFKLMEDIQRNSYFGLQCVFLVDDKPHLDGKTRRGIRIYGHLDQLVQIARRHRIDEIYLAQNGCDTRRIHPLLEQLQSQGIMVRILPNWSGLTAFGRPTTVTIGSSILFTASDSPLSGANHYMKDLFDRVVALFLLCLFAGPMLLIAAAVKVSDKGPVLYRQDRVGMDGRTFKILKFRTMQHIPSDSPGWTVRDDPRRTRIGAFLRSTSLDELPQLFNVLRGQMSLVGPRPEQPHFVEKFSEDYKKYMFRHKVKAGMTGWAQIHGFRGDTSLRKRIQYDLHYIQNWSIWLDLLILLRTPFHILKQKNAY